MPHLDNTKIYGEIYGEEVAYTIADLGLADTYNQILGFDTNGEFNGTTPDHTQDHIIILTKGIYRIFFDMMFSGSVSSVFKAYVFKNNGTTQLVNVGIHRAIGTGGDIGATAASGLASLDVGDTIELWVSSTGDNKSITIDDVVLSVIKIG